MSGLGTIGDATVIECALSRTRVFKAIKDKSSVRGVSIVLSCQKCPAISAMAGQSQWEPTRVSRTFRDAGWEVDGEGRDARCPDCKKRRRGPGGQIPIGKSVAPPPPSEPSPKPAATSLSLVPDLAAVREITSVIDKKIDEVARSRQPATPAAPEAIPSQTPKARAPTGKPRVARTYSPHVCAYKGCGKTFIPTGCKAKYCSHACQRAFHGRPAEFEAHPRAARASAATSPAPVASSKPPKEKTMRTTQEPPRVAAERAIPKATTSATAVGSAPPQTPEAIKAERKMYVLLESHYLPEDHHYEYGWGDARIAAEAGVAELRVRFVREGLYGTAVDPKVAELGAAIDGAIEANAAERTDLLALVRETLERHDKALRDLKARLAALTEGS